MENHVNANTEKKAVLFVATLSSFFTPFMLSAVNVAVPSIGQEFAMDAIWLSWIPVSFLLSSTIFLVPFGKIADMYGHTKIFTYGVIIFTLMSIVQIFSNSAPMFIVFRALQGIGAAMIFVTAIAIVTSVFSLEERGKALGMTIAAVYLGISFGPFLGGLLTEHLGWRSIFLLTVPLGLITVIATFWKLKAEWAEVKTRKFDLTGSIIYGIAMLALIYGISLLPELYGIWAIIFGISGLCAFFWWETKIEYPVLQIDLFKGNKVFIFSNLAALFHYSATFSIIFLVNLYLQYAKGLSPFDAGLILVSMPVMQAIFSPLAGRLSDRIQPGVLASLGMGIDTIGLILLIFLNQDTHIGYLVFSLIIIGFGVAFFASPNSNAILSSVDRRFLGTASAILSTMRQTGGMLSMGVVMLIFTLFIGRVEITPEYYHEFVRSFRLAVSISAALCFSGVFLSLGRTRTK